MRTNASCAIRTGCRVIDDLDVIGFRLNGDRWLVADFAARLDCETDAVVVDGQRADFSAVIKLQIVPFPAWPDQIVGKETCRRRSNCL